MAAATRVYKAVVAGTARLVRASHPSHVTAHVARDLIAVTVATQDDLIAGLQGGLQIEAVKAEQQELPAT